MITRAEILLTLTGPLSHHDPAIHDDSNTLLFNRAKQLYRRAQDAAPSTQEEVDALCAAHPVPGDMAPILQDLSYPEFAAIALARLFIDMYNAGDGEGLFSGMARYRRLEERARAAAVRSASLPQWWNRLTTDMQVAIHGGSQDEALFSLVSASRGTQEAVLRMLTREHRSIVSLARYWHDLSKKQSERYAAKAGVEQAAPSVALTWDAASLRAETAPIIDIEVPAIQGNGVRHQCVRAPGWLHLVRTLGIPYGFPGEGMIPAGVEAIFENGGNIAGGSKPSGNPHGHSWNIRKAFPLLDLLGGCTDSFDLGESRLKLGAWIVGKENREALGGAASLPNASVSLYDMLTEVTQTRQASSQGLGQMIYNCEALAAGTQILVRFSLDPFTPELTKGAFVAAIETYLENPILGGQSRAGFGSAEGEWLVPVEGAAESRERYETYLSENKDELLESLKNGMLGATAQVVS